MRAHSDLKPEDIVAICDTREQKPLELELRTERGTLATGDYSVAGLEHFIAVERKELSDLIACVGVERERFDREIQRLMAYQTRAIVVESTWGDLELGAWRSKVTVAAAMGSVLGWIAQGIPIVMAGNRMRAGKMVSRILFLAARRRFRELQSFHSSLKIYPQAVEDMGTELAKRLESLVT